MAEYPPMFVLYDEDNEKRLVLFGAYEDTRSDGTGKFVVAQGFLSYTPMEIGTLVWDESGQEYKLLKSVERKFSLQGIVLELEEE